MRIDYGARFQKAPSVAIIDGLGLTSACLVMLDFSLRREAFIAHQ